MPRRSTPQPLPAALEAAGKRFEEWRSSPQRKKRVPDELWSLAIGLAGEFGTYRTACSLRLNYMSLRKRVEPTDVNSSAKKEREQAVTFREVRPASTTPLGQCVVELDDPAGIKMRLYLGAVDAAVFARSFLRGQA